MPPEPRFFCDPENDGQVFFKARNKGKEGFKKSLYDPPKTSFPVGFSRLVVTEIKAFTARHSLRRAVPPGLDGFQVYTIFRVRTEGRPSYLEQFGDNFSVVPWIRHG